MSTFRFKQFSILQADNAMKVGTDAMLLGAIAHHQSPQNILDIGTGTGVLSLMLAQKYSESTILAVELDELAAKECQLNFDRSPWTSRLKIDHRDFLSFESLEKFDLLISNPPYYQSRQENQDSRKSMARHESSLPVGLMLKKSVTLMHENSQLWVVVPSESLEDWLEKAKSNQLFCVEGIAIHGKKNAPPKRHILSFGLVDLPLKSSSFTIRDENGDYTQEYIDLTFDFHFNDLRKATE